MSPILVTIFTLIAIAITIALLFVLAFVHKVGRTNKQSTIAGVITIAFILIGISFGLATKSNPAPASEIIMINAIILAFYLLIVFLTYQWNKNRVKTPLSTRKIAFLGILVGLSSALMLLGFPVIPGFVFLKVELSGLIILMALLWFDFKTAVLVSLFTNFIHVFMPGTPPLILFLDEGVNFIATMVFLAPIAIFVKKRHLETKEATLRILIVSSAGVLFTTLVMTLYNYFINLPIIYSWPMPFSTVVQVFGLFNVIKWGLVALVVNLTWRRLYSLRSIGEEEYCEL